MLTIRLRTKCIHMSLANLAQNEKSLWKYTLNGTCPQISSLTTFTHSWSHINYSSSKTNASHHFLMFLCLDSFYLSCNLKWQANIMHELKTFFFKNMFSPPSISTCFGHAKNIITSLTSLFFTCIKKVFNIYIFCVK